jgi:hypothetical protein
LLLVLLVAFRDTFSIFARTQTILPAALTDRWQAAADAVTTLSAGNLKRGNPVRDCVAAYSNIAGIEVGYGFFAPNVPANYRLIFELHYPDGHIEHDIPVVGSLAAGIRLAGLLDFIAETDSVELRQVLLKFLTESIWREHPSSKTIKTVLERANLPTPEGFLHGQKESDEILDAYTFSFALDQPGD